jgi:hypothetical protein
LTEITPADHVHPPLFDLCIITAFGYPVNSPEVSRVIDKGCVECYNTCMTKRTARSDSNYIIYAATHNGQSYIGLTRKGNTTVPKAVKERWRKHVSRARNEDRDWVIYNYMREGNWTDWAHEVICIIRGRAEAYAYERALVKEIQPELNDQYIG